MLEPLFTILGLANNLFLIAIFVLRRRRMDLVRRIGPFYLLLALPAAYGLYLALRQGQAAQYGTFLGITLAFLALEGVYDYVLKIPFRENWNWKLLVPYLLLYWAMNYGFVVMAWQDALPKGIVMLALFVVQIVTNAISHPRKRRKDAQSAEDSESPAKT